MEQTKVPLARRYRLLELSETENLPRLETEKTPRSLDSRPRVLDSSTPYNFLQNCRIRDDLACLMHFVELNRTILGRHWFVNFEGSQARRYSGIAVPCPALRKRLTNKKQQQHNCHIEDFIGVVVERVKKLHFAFLIENDLDEALLWRMKGIRGEGNKPFYSKF